MKVAEIRMSLLEKGDKDDKEKHTKHVAVTITDPEVCDAIVAAIGKKHTKAKDAAHLYIKSAEEKAADKAHAKEDADAEADEEEEQEATA
jgi:hypothetical protein